MKIGTFFALTFSTLPAFASGMNVPICELLQHPTRYDGKLIRTHGTTVADNGSGCASTAPLWVETYDGRFGADLGRPGAIKVTVTEIFHWRPSAQDQAVLDELLNATRESH
jgi:hypothetical protein